MYNKNLVSKGFAPKGFDVLVNPELKGKMGISTGETSGKIIGAMIKTKGEEFVKKLKAQEIKLYTIDPPALVTSSLREKLSRRRRSFKPILCLRPRRARRWDGCPWK